jgi:iron complex outermembrane receptor protein
MKKHVLLFLFLGIGHFIYAQSIMGTVTDAATGDPLIGANITVVGMDIGGITDADGTYKIDTKSGVQTIKVSYIGYKDAMIEVTVEGTMTVDVTLESGVLFGDEIVISASRRAEKLTNSPATIEMISTEQIESYAGNASELLARQKGIDYFRAGIAGPAFNVRGFNSNFNSKNLQVTDGRFSSLIATGLPFGALDPVLQDDVERVEVILGPNSTMYGPNAHNGLLNTITKDPRKYQGTTVTLTPGVSGDGDAYWGARLRHAQVINDKLAFKVNAGYTKAKEFEYVDSVYINRDTIPGNEAYEELELDRDVTFLKANAEVIYSPNKDWDISLGTGYSNSTFLSPTNVGRNQIKDWNINYYQLKVTNDNWFAQVYYTTSKTDSTYSIDDRTKQYYRLLDAGFSDSEARGPQSYATGALFKDNSNRLNGEIQYNNNFGGLQLITGVQYQRDLANSEGTYLLDGGPDGDGISVTQVGGYLHLKYDINKNWRSIAAARVDNHEIYGTNFIPKFGVLRIGDYGTWRLTYGQGIAAPTILNMFGNLFNGLILGNSEGFTLADGTVVDPQSVEKLSTIELGYRGRTENSKLFFDINGYYNINKDFLSPVTVVGVTTQRGDTPIDQVQSGFAAYGGLVATYINFGQVNTYGVDLGFDYLLNDNWSANFNYSYFDYSVDEDNLDNDFNNDGKVNFLDILVNAPNHKCGAGLSYSDAKWNGSLYGRWVQAYNYFSSFQIASETIEGEVYRGTPIVENSRSTDSYNYGPLGGFVTFDLNVAYKLTDKIQLGVTATNLLNTELREFTAAAPTKGLYTLMLRYHFDPSKN